MTTFNYDGSVIQFDTITTSGKYDILASGGQGGSSSNDAGGLAASSGGDIFLQAGAVLEIVVGGAGANSIGNGAGGGGGSFVIEINDGSGPVDINEVIAGGGGGAGLHGVGETGLTGPTGGFGNGLSSGAGGFNGAAGTGGRAGGGGGGFAGGNGGSSSGTGDSGTAGGNNFTGGVGGANGGSGGGFGGGGGGGFSGGGGGGGYGGGGGGGRLGSSGGGGGGSHVNPLATNVTQSAGVRSGNGVVDITPLCFCLGTRIQTVRGEIAVEDLAIGDYALTASGKARPVQWIGRRRIDLTRHADPSRARPVRIAAGGFPGGLPHRDLLVSPDHAVVFDGTLIPAKLLVNGASIAADTVCREVTYFHVELAGHDILLAEGLAAESYLDTGNRGMFENGDQPMLLHPDFGTGQQARVSRSCLPFADRPDQVEPVWRALAERAEALGWALPRPVLTDDPDLHVLVGTRRIDPVAVRNGRYTFVLPPGGAPVTLASRAARPTEARPWVADDRRLGAMVRRLVHRSGDDMRDLAMDALTLEQGWWAVELDAGRPCRWTSGRAMLPFLGAGVLEVEVSGTIQYPAVHAVPAVAAQPERAAA